MMEESPFRHLLKKPLSARQARNVARALKGKGYKVTIGDCRGRSPIDLMWFCEPIGNGDDGTRATEKHKQLIAVIVKATKMIPSRIKFTEEESEWMLDAVGLATVHEMYMKRVYL